jgi:signal transduction histidine kinase
MGSAQRVVIAEDDFLVREKLRGVLEDAGYRVVGHASSGTQAVALTAELQPDVVMMDIDLRELDGLAAARHITAECPTPIVALTAHESADLVAQASKSGVGYYLVKPAGRREIARAIAIAVARFEDWMELRRLNASLQDEITERKRAEEALSRSEARFRTLFEAMIEGVALHKLIYDEAGDPVDYRILHTNPAYERHTGISPTRAQGTLASELYGTDTRPPYLEIYTRVAETGTPTSFTTYFPPLSKHFHISVFSPAKGQFATIFQDVTPYKRMEEQLEEYAAQLQRSNQELEQFAYVVSHDLQAPLRMISGYLKLLLGEYQGGELNDEETEELLNYAMNGTKRMQAMICGLLDLSRVETRGQEFTPVAVREIVEYTLQVLWEELANADAQVSCDPLPMVMGDEAQLTQVFQNLIANAVKFRQPDTPPQVHIAAQRQDGEWLFSVQDNGIGINPSQAQRVFQIFQRLHTEEEYPGVGIGLALCKRIVERHGGHIWVETEPEQGTAFCFTLPACEEGTACAS